MSTIVVVRKGRRACIAADSLTSFGDIRLAAQHDCDSDKIQTIGKTHLGLVGSAAHTLVVENALQKPKLAADFSSRDQIFRTLMRLHKKLKDDYYLNPEESEEDPYESSRFDGVMVNRRGIFGLYSMREVYEYKRFWAAGAGAEIALGAMHALYDRLDTCEQIATAAVEAAAEFNNATALPLTLESVKLKGI